MRFFIALSGWAIRGGLALAGALLLGMFALSVSQAAAPDIGWMHSMQASTPSHALSPRATPRQCRHGQARHGSKPIWLALPYLPLPGACVDVPDWLMETMLRPLNRRFQADRSRTLH